MDNSNYHALSAKLTQRFSKGLTYMLGYTWSKAIDGGSGIRTNSGDTLWPVNSYDLRAERGLSQFDLRRLPQVGYSVSGSNSTRYLCPFPGP